MKTYWKKLTALTILVAMMMMVMTGGMLGFAEGEGDPQNPPADISDVAGGPANNNEGEPPTDPGVTNMIPPPTQETPAPGNSEAQGTQSPTPGNGEAQGTQAPTSGNGEAQGTQPPTPGNGEAQGTQAPTSGNGETQETPPPASNSTDSLNLPPVEYVIEYSYFDGESEQVFTAKVLDTQTIEKPEIMPVMEGYAFAFWYDAAGEVVEFVFGGAPTANITLKAHFVPEMPKEQTDGLEGDLGDGAGLNGGEEGKTGTTVDGVDLIIVDDDECGESEVILIEPEAVPLAGPQLSVTVVSNVGEFVQYGDTITLTAQATGLEGLGYTVTWRYFDGAEWHVAESDGGLMYSYTLMEENIDWIFEIEIAIHSVASDLESSGETVVL